MKRGGASELSLHVKLPRPQSLLRRRIPSHVYVHSRGNPQQIERVFRGLKDGDWLGWGPMYHWTDSKIRVHAFYCMLGISLLNYLDAQAQKVCPQITVEQMKGELEGIHEFVLLYPPQGAKGPNRVATVQGRQTLTQSMLAEGLGLRRLS